MKIYALALSVICLFSASVNCKEVSEKGYWIGEVADWHVTDWYLADAMVDFLKLEGVSNIVDFGCGSGEYVQTFLRNGIDAIGYDGNPETPILTAGAGQVLDLSESFDLGTTFDWVISLEVGEHLPHQYERIFIENLMRHADKGIILSWALKNQPGVGHFNCQDNDYIKSIFAKHGYINDIEAENHFRKVCLVEWFKKTIMVFRSPL